MAGGLQRLWVALAGIGGASGVALAAYGAHGGLEEHAARLLASAVEMQLWHVLALLAAALWSPRGGAPAHLAAAGFALGLVLFCATVAAGALGLPRFGPLAPVGGTMLMASWGLLTVSALRPAKRPA